MLKLELLQADNAGLMTGAGGSFAVMQQAHPSFFWTWVLKLGAGKAKHGTSREKTHQKRKQNTSPRMWRKVWS